MAKGNVRPSSFFVVPGSSRTTPAWKSTRSQVRPKTSDFLHPVKWPNSATGRISSGRWPSMARKSASSKNPWRALLTVIVGKWGLRVNFSSSSARRNMDLSAASWLRIVAGLAPWSSFRAMYARIRAVLMSTARQSEPKNSVRRMIAASSWSSDRRWFAL